MALYSCNLQGIDISHDALMMMRGEEILIDMLAFVPNVLYIAIP